MESAMAEADLRGVFENDRGEKLMEWGLPGHDSPKAICIMVHGVGDHVACYKPIAKHMWDKYEISMVGYDQVGHGKSEGTRVDIKDFQYYVDDLLMYKSKVKEKYPDLPLFIMGHSMGGLVLGHAVLRDPNLCDGIIMYAAAIDTNPEVVTPFKIRMAKILSYILPQCPVGGIDAKFLTRNETELAKLKVDPLRHHGGMKARWGSMTLRALVDFNARMADIKLPVLIAHGDDDLVCRIDGSQKFNETITSTDKTFKVYEKCYHSLHREPDGAGEAFIEDVCQWIDSRTQGKR